MNSMFKYALAGVGGVLLGSGIAYAGTGSSESYIKHIVCGTDSCTSHKRAAQEDKEDDMFFHSFDEWDPSQEFQSLQHHIDRMFRRSMASLRQHTQDGTIVTEEISVPAIDVHSTDKAYIVTADVPGAENTKLSATIDDNVLTITGSRATKNESKNDQGKVIFEERSTGKFERAFTLPGPVDGTKMTTSYKDGVYTITIPKA